ncbi:STAS domain-containing protein [Streptomyces sp. NPDC057301]|uniref:STAS domain-containing protein n=1 Tax=Streptomyces sp. NPDC057301 TaxID=3346093 RepID=UPI00363BA9C9
MWDSPNPRLTIVRSAEVWNGHDLVMSLIGELDADTAPAVCEATVSVMSNGGRRILVDLSGVTLCDNASLYTLLGVRHALSHAGGELTLISPSEAVRLALLRTGLRELLPMGLRAEGRLTRGNVE